MPDTFTRCKSPDRKTREQALLRRTTRLRTRIENQKYRANRLAWARLALFVLLLVIGIALGLSVNVWVGGFAALLGLVIFDFVARTHNRVKDSIQRTTIWVEILDMHLARMRLNWEKLPTPCIKSPRLDVPLELDLDLVGPRSIHHLIDTCVSAEGSTRLRDWIASSTPDPELIRQRQTLIREITARPLFRDKLTLNGVVSSRKATHRWNGQRLLAWLDAHSAHPVPGNKLILILTILGAANGILFALNQMGHIPALWGLTFIPYAALYLWSVQQLGDPFDQALALADPLNDLKGIFHLLERFPYGETPALAKLCEAFQSEEDRPTKHLRQLTRVMSAASVRRNPLLWTLISAVTPWDLFVARWLERHRAALIDKLPGWLDTWFELEALSALATFAYLNPDNTYPQVTSDTTPPVLTAREIGHPLLPASERVCNDFTIGDLGELALITGSNMSGKSTFLRTVGVNLCLANAGSTVCASSLTTAPFRLFTCIRVTDSVTNGISYFYAEVKRLKALLDALETEHPYALFYLIDEIFRGTNNRERLIGSESYIKALVGGHGTGALSTHDLELVQLAHHLPKIKNYHFEETIADGRMKFDYTLLNGPSPTTNALKIMEMEGLPVAVSKVES